MTSGEVVPLRQHLGADKNACAAAIDVGKMCSSAPLRLVVSRSIRKSGYRETAVPAPAQAVRSPNLPVPDALSRRRGTGAESGFNVAVVAAQMMLSLVQRVVAVAARTLRYPAAVVAQQRRREAAAVQKTESPGYRPADAGACGQ